MARSAPPRTHVVHDPAATRELISPLRQELIDTLQALGGEASVASLAEQLGRSADGLYYHLRKLCSAGLISELPDRGDGQGRRYLSRAGRGGRLQLDYRAATDSTQQAELRKLVRGLLGMARRDFDRALGTPEATTEGARRTLWALRCKAWLSPDELEALNDLLAQVLDLLVRPRSPERDVQLSLSWILAPQQAQPKRRPPRTAR